MLLRSSTSPSVVAMTRGFLRDNRIFSGRGSRARKPPALPTIEPEDFGFSASFGC